VIDEEDIDVPIAQGSRWIGRGRLSDKSGAGKDFFVQARVIMRFSVLKKEFTYRIRHNQANSTKIMLSK